MASSARSANSSQDNAAVDAFARLRRESRPRRWLLAVVIGAALGFVVGWAIFGSWVAALLIAGVVTVVLLRWDDRFGLVTGWRPGDGGQAELLAAAARLEKAGWHVQFRPAIQGSDTTPDLLLVGPGGFAVVACQAWGFADRVRTGADSEVFVGGRPAAQRVTGIRTSASRVRDTLTEQLGRDVDVVPLLAVHGLTLANQRGVLPRTVADVTILQIAELGDRLMQQKPVLNATEAIEIARIARQLFGPHSQHL